MFGFYVEFGVFFDVVLEEFVGGDLWDFEFFG